LAFSAVNPIVSAQAPLTTAQIARRVSPSVVVIEGKTDSGDAFGSGFIISKDGKIATSFHVIRDMKTASVQTATGEVFDSLSVLATDERHDLAIVQVAGFNLPDLPLGNSDLLAVGDPVVVVGSPRGLEGTVTAGIVSSVRDSGGGFKVLQTDAAVNPGNSGGPLLNNKGQAIGVVSFKLPSAEALNFAIPINYVRGLLNALHDPISLERMRRGLQATKSETQQSIGPSLKETLDWLKEKIPLAAVEWVHQLEGSGRQESVNFQSKVWSLDSCNAVLGYEWVLIPTDPAEAPSVTITDRFAIPLGAVTKEFVSYWENEMWVQIEPTPRPHGKFVSGQPESYHLSLFTQAKEISLTISSSYRPIPPGGERPLLPTTTQSTSMITFRFPDESVARRVMDAFHHAADLCRQSREPF